METKVRITNKNATFSRWMRFVDAKIAARLYGMTSSDLPDCTYRDWYDQGMTASAAASKALRNARDE